MLPRTTLHNLVKSSNYGARGGQIIAGALGRGTNGKFARVGAPDAAQKVVDDLVQKRNDAAATKRAKKRTAKKQQAKQGGGKGAGAKPKKPTLTPEQKQAAKDAARKQNREKTFSALGLAEDAVDSLNDLFDGKPVDDDGGLEKMGLAERGRDGQLRLTAKGRQVYNAAGRGDAGAAKDALSQGRDTVAKNADRAVANEQKRVAREAKRAEAAAKKQQREAERAKRRAEVDARRQAREQRAGSKRRRAVEDSPEAAPIRLMTKAQTAQERAMFAKMGGGGSGGGATLDRVDAEAARGPVSAKTRNMLQRQYESSVRQGDMSRADITAARDGFAARAKQSKREVSTLKRKYTEDNPRVRTIRAEQYTAEAFQSVLSQVAERYDRLAPEQRTKATDARALLRQAIDLHQAHMDGTEPTSDASQQKLMTLMERAFAALPGRAMPTMKAAHADTTQISVVKAGDRLRWVMRSSTTFRDKDGEIVSKAALERAVARMKAGDAYGPLRWWHVPGLDIGDCDFSVVVGRTLIESGTFRDDRYAAGIKSGDEVSLGFVYAPGSREPDGTFTDIIIRERSVCPPTTARNHFTGAGSS